MTRSARALLLAVPILLTAFPARAGDNSGGTVGLSWDASGDSTSGTAAGGVTFPLFLHLYDAPDIQELAVTIRWIPYDSTGQCYSVIRAPLDSVCGWATDEQPGGAFEGDSSYTWSIHFPPGEDKDCVVYWVSTLTCDSIPSAKFYVSSVYVMDSLGAVDTLRRVADARLLGGANPDTSYFGQSRRAPTDGGRALTLTAVPNPTSASMLLRFSLPRPMAFHLGVYDVSGRLIRRAGVSPDAAGKGQFLWDLTTGDGQRVLAGVYFARLVSAAGSRVVTMTVLR